MKVMLPIQESIGNLFLEQGCVKAELYEEALDALDQIKKQVINEFAKSEEEREVGNSGGLLEFRDFV
jgi:hypothetical protein